MPPKSTKKDRAALAAAIESQNAALVTSILNRADAKKLLMMEDDSGFIPLHNACESKSSTAVFKPILDSAVRHKVIKEMLEEKTLGGWNCIIIALFNQLPFDSFRLLIESCIHHGADTKKMLEQKTGADFNCIMLGTRNQLPANSFKLLLESCARHGLDMKAMLEQKTPGGWNCITLYLLIISHYYCELSMPSRLIKSPH